MIKKFKNLYPTLQELKIKKSTLSFQKLLKNLSTLKPTVLHFYSKLRLIRTWKHRRWNKMNITQSEKLERRISDAAASCLPSLRIFPFTLACCGASSLPTAEPLPSLQQTTELISPPNYPYLMPPPPNGIRYWRLLPLFITIFRSFVTFEVSKSWIKSSKALWNRSLDCSG